MTIALHAVLKGVGADSPVRGLHRVVWLNEKTNRLFLVPIPTWGKDEKPPRYYKGPREWSYTAVDGLQLSGDVAETQLAPHRLAGLSDEQIRERYPKRTKVMKKKRARTDSAPLQFRDERWNWVEPIIQYVEANREEAFEYGGLCRVVKERAVACAREEVDIYDAVHRVLAHGAGKASLLSALHRCGGSGKSRTPRSVQRLGRVNAAYASGRLPSPGIHLSDEDKRFLAIGHSKFLRQGLSVRAAYMLTMGAWWSQGSTVEDGVEQPILKPAHERPTLAQFRYWGPRDSEGKSAYELLLKEGEWEQRFRAMLGSSMHGLNGAGQMAVVDATGLHVAFSSMTSPLDAIGQGHRIVVHDGLNEVITGWYVGLEAPGQRTANLAIYNSAIDKVAIFARFNLTITSDQVPATFYRLYRVDNGELRNEGSIQILSGMSSGIDFVERRRPERKQQAEGGHRSIQVLLDNPLDGGTRGKRRARGEEHSAVDGCWTWYAYMREFLRAVIYFNCHLDATSVMNRHPFRTEMLRDGVPPIRAKMYEWCIKNNRVGIPAHNAELLKVKLAPQYRAVVKQTGIYLLRPDRGDKDEIVRGLRYSGPRAMELRWHEGKRPDFHITLGIEPESLNRAWYVDDMGIHEFQNLSEDQTARREGTLHDYLAAQDRQHEDKLANQSDADQAESKFITDRETRNQAFRAEKKAAIAAAGGKVSKSRLKSNITENRANEAERIAALLDPVTRAPKVASPVANTVGGTQPVQSDAAQPSEGSSATATDRVAELSNDPSLFVSNGADGVGCQGAADGLDAIAASLAQRRARRRSR